MTAQTTTLSEVTALTEAAQPGRRRRIKLIAAGWSKNGRFYSPQVLAEAAAARIFPAGMPMYIDHPTQSDKFERPERSLKDLAARLASDATYQNDGLYAEASLVGPWAGFVNEVLPDLSIMASGATDYGEASGRKGEIVTSIDQAASVDFVTEGAAGGKLLELLEATRVQLAEARNVGAWFESRLHSVFTQMADDMYGDGRLTRDERIGLSKAISDALAAFTTRIETDQPQIYQRDLGDEPDSTQTSADMAETITPAPPAVPLEEARMSGAPQPGAPTNGPVDLSEAATLRAELDTTRQELTEAKQKLADASLKVAQFGENAAQLSEAKQQLADAQRENLRLRADGDAQRKAVEALAESTLPEVAHARVIAAVTGSNVPLNDEGGLDEARLVESIRGAIENERRYLAQFAESAGMGSVRGLGSSGVGELAEADMSAALEGVFSRLGMDDKSAKLAAKGR
jgi:hypothetical protein